MRDDFAVFILTHGRAKQQKTLETLTRCGYTGRIYLIIDDEDEQRKEYHDTYGVNVIEFSKQEIEKTFDTMTNVKEYRSPVYARNAAYGIAKKLNVRYLMTMDDDLTDLKIRAIRDGKLKAFTIKNIDRLFESMCTYLETANVAMLGFSYAAVYIGRAHSKAYSEGYHRNLTQAALVDVEHPVYYRGIFNEDYHAALDLGCFGKLALGTVLIQIASPERSTNKGGLHDLYKSTNNYVRDCYSLMLYPNVVRFVGKSGELKSQANSKAFAAMVLNQRYRKAAM